MTTDESSIPDRLKVALFVDNNYIIAIIIHMEYYYKYIIFRQLGD